MQDFFEHIAIEFEGLRDDFFGAFVVPTDGIEDGVFVAGGLLDRLRLEYGIDGNLELVEIVGFVGTDRRHQGLRCLHQVLLFQPGIQAEQLTTIFGIEAQFVVFAPGQNEVDLKLREMLEASGIEPKEPTEQDEDSGDSDAL